MPVTTTSNGETIYDLSKEAARLRAEADAVDRQIETLRAGALTKALDRIRDLEAQLKAKAET